MSVDALVRRMLSQASQVTVSAMKLGKLSETEKKMLTLGAERLGGLSMWLTTDVVSTTQLEAALDVYTPGTLGLVVVDYLQLMKPAETMRDSRARVEAVSEELKRLSVRFDLPFLVLSSLRRPERATPNWRPTNADLRESGELEHDADAILLLHREPDGDILEVDLSKQRDGSIGKVTLGFHGATVSFTEGK